MRWSAAWTPAAPYPFSCPPPSPQLTRYSHCALPPGGPGPPHHRVCMWDSPPAALLKLVSQPLGTQSRRALCHSTPTALSPGRASACSPGLPQPLSERQGCLLTPKRSTFSCWSLLYKLNVLMSGVGIQVDPLHLKACVLCVRASCLGA